MITSGTMPCYITWNTSTPTTALIATAASPSASTPRYALWSVWSRSSDNCLASFGLTWFWARAARAWLFPLRVLCCSLCWRQGPRTAYIRLLGANISCYLCVKDTCHCIASNISRVNQVLLLLWILIQSWRWRWPYHSYWVCNIPLFAWVSFWGSPRLADIDDLLAHCQVSSVIQEASVMDKKPFILIHGLYETKFSVFVPPIHLAVLHVLQMTLRMHRGV